MTVASTKPVWTHITIAVSDVDKSVAFYREWCGLRVARDRRLEGGSTVWLSTADDIATERDFVLVIGAGEAACPVNHFGFQFDSVESATVTTIVCASVRDNASRALAQSLLSCASEIV